MLVATIVAAPLMASGTYSPGSAGVDDYNLAKKIFYKKVVCSRCPFPGRGKNVEDAQQLLQEIDAAVTAGTLSEQERGATITYLYRRFQ